jgi:hypothetical protein
VSATQLILRPSSERRSLVVTDNWAVELKYYSRRLTRQIVDQDAAARRNRLRKISFGIPSTGVAAEFGRSEIDRANPYDLVRRATTAVSDNTGSLISPGAYVRATLDLSWNAVPVLMGWERAISVPVACFFADVEVDEIGGVFVGLFGSAANFLGVAEPEYSGGWMPSEVDGLYQMLDDTTEPEDPRVSAKFLGWDRDTSSAKRIRSAVTLFQHTALPGRELMDVLAKPYAVERDVDFPFMV